MDSRVGSYSAVTGVFIFLIALLLAICAYPNFSLFSPRQSISDLGSSKSPNPYIFNVGVILSSIFFLIFAVNLFKIYEDVAFKFSAYFFASFILIAIFTEGTPLHLPAAITFFLLSFIAIILWCVRRMGKIGIFLISLEALSLIVYALHEYLGFAFAELFGGSIVILWVLVVSYLDLWKKG